jgi:hypothetical protein
MKRLGIAGFAIWLLATLVLRLAGRWVIDPSSPVGVFALLALSAPVMYVLPRRLFRKSSIEPRQYALGAIVLVAPGMLLDTISAIWFPIVFPNIRPDAAGLFGGWLLFCNVLALVSAATAARRDLGLTVL